MNKKPAQANQKQPVKLLPTVATTHVVAARVILPDAAFKNRDRHPSADGPWAGEYDKLGWVDEATSLRCIILRQRNGSLSGYVAVPSDHPLYGFDKDAIPSGINLTVHGGLTYAAACEKNNDDERISICHVSKFVRRGTKNVFNDHEETWWLGFDTDLDCDLVPTLRHRSSAVVRTYRDQAYVYREIIRLAARLSEIATGVPIKLDDDVKAQVPPVTFRK